MSIVKEYTHKEIITMIESLPGSWEQVSLRTYVEKLQPLIIRQVSSELETVLDKTNTDDSILNTVEYYEFILRMASEFIPEFTSDQLEQWPSKYINQIVKKLSFIDSKPIPLEEKNCKYKWVSTTNEPSMNKTIIWLKIHEQFQTGDMSAMPALISNICLNEVSMDEILNMDMREVETGFFLLRRALTKYSEPIITSLIMEIVKLRNKEVRKKKNKVIK